ncbi:MAG TPA: PQQ-binding-like beta-propeller repeat protein, partial [Yinghuangia sp.]|nr:PQQ-binding-like beta-propeller repeat protein [Yinghuangia sp.]
TIAVQALDAARDTGVHQIPVQAGPPPRPSELPATVGRAARTDHAVPGRPQGHATPPPPGFPPNPHTRPAVEPRSPARGPSRRQALLGVGGVLLAAGAGAAVWAAVRDSSSPGAQPSSPPPSGPPKPERQLWAFSAQGPIVSPPVLAGQRVLFGSADGPLHAVNLLDPTQSWTFPAPGGRVQRWNITAVENTAYVNGGDTTVHALDAGSGEEQAAYALDGVPGPVVGNAQSALYVGTGNGTLYCLDRRQSDVRSATYWDWTWKSGIPLGEPSVWDTGRGLVVAVGAQDRSLHLIAATAFTDNSGREYHQGSRLRQSQDAGRLSRPIWWGRRVLYGVGTTVVWGLDVDSTTVIGVDTKGPVVTVLAALDDVVLVDNGAGKLRCISYPQGRELWSADVGGTVLGCAAADGWVIARTDDTLHVLPLTGPPGWSFEARGTTLSTAIAKLPMVYFGAGDGNVYAFDVGGEGKPVWTYPAGAPVTQPLQLGDGILFAGTDAGVLHAVTIR